MAKTNRKIRAALFVLLAALCVCLGGPTRARATTGLPLPSVNISIGGTGDQVGEDTAAAGTTGTLQMLFLVTILALAPSIVIVMTSFTRIIISLHFLRTALGTQQMPPNQVLIGLALFLTIFAMSPTIATINETAFQPMTRGEITQEQAIDAAVSPMREFMFRQVKPKDLALFSKIAGVQYTTGNPDEVPTTVLIPAFILGEMTWGFEIGFALYMPFIVIDMVVASVLMAMGMMMLPPAMISLPFKILLFIMVDGWNLMVQMLFMTFR